jgi:hypothetical protein
VELAPERFEYLKPRGIVLPFCALWRDQALLAILRGAERKVADTPIQRHDNPIRRQLLAIPDNAWGGWGGRGYSTGGPNFSTHLFGGRSHQTTREPRQPVVQALLSVALDGGMPAGKRAD